MFRDIWNSLTTSVDIQSSGHWLAEGIIFTLFLCIVIVIIIKFQEEVKDFRDNHELLFKICIGTFLIIVFVALIEKLLISSLNIFGQSTFVSLIGISGVLATVVSLVIAYRQLRLSEDRIDSYERLYERLNTILKRDMMKLENDKTKELKKFYRFQFYGGTLIPGQIAYGKGKENEHIKEYLELLKKLAEELKDKFEIILPSDELLKTTYAPYYNISNIDIKKEIKDVIEFKKEIEDRGGYVIEVTEGVGLQYLNWYYFAIGDKIIYATAVHYQISQAIFSYGQESEKEKKHKPLHGFLTSNRKILEESRDIFDNFKKVLTEQREILKYMYSKHLVNVKYIDKKLELQNCSRNNIVSKDNLYSIDQEDHFSELEGTKKCIQQISIKETDRILDIGGGFGGPARYIADTTGARVWSIEIQKDRYDLSKHLTNEMLLSKKVITINGDFVAYSFEEGSYTKVIAFLSILHIIKKDLAIQKISRLLETEGMVYIEDYYRTRELKDEEKQRLLEIISCPGLLTDEDYKEELEKNNIEIISCDDLTNDWKGKAIMRSENMERDKEKIIGWYKDETKVEDAIEFAKEVSKLFNDGVIHGFRIVGRKK